MIIFITFMHRTFQFPKLNVDFWLKLSHYQNRAFVLRLGFSTPVQIFNPGITRFQFRNYGIPVLKTLFTLIIPKSVNEAKRSYLISGGKFL